MQVIKNSDGAKFIPSRLVARDFAATPPLDTLKSMLPLAFMDNLEVTFMQVKRAHLIGVVKPEGGNDYVQAPGSPA